MFFRDRTDAGQKLAQHLARFANRSDVVVLAVPRGGVVIAIEVAAKLRAPLRLFVIRKLGVPGQEELAFGAVSSGGVRVLDREVISSTGLSAGIIDEVTRQEQQELARRERLYQAAHQGHSALNLRGKIALLVDDGIATGSSLRAGVHGLRQLQPAAVIIAAPVAPLSTVNTLKNEADDVICVATPENFRGVGQFYENFDQVSDQEVIALMRSVAVPQTTPHDEASNSE